nr:unnamed protein product [Callosobruchus chinensis]
MLPVSYAENITAL